MSFVFHNQQDDDPNYEENVKKYLGFRILTILTTVIAVALFILTENMQLPMITIDKYTLWHAVIAVATLILAILSRKKYSKEELNRNQAYGK